MATNEEELKDFYKADSSKEHHNRLKDKLDANKQNRYFLDQVRLTNYLSIFTDDKYTLTPDGTINRILYSTKERGKTYLRVNRNFSIYKTTYAKMWNTLPLITASPESLSSESEFTAELCESILRKEYPQWRKNGVYPRSLMWYILSGDSFVKTQYNKDLGNNAVIDNNGKTIKEGMVEIVSRMPFNIYFDTMCPYVDQAMEVFEVVLVHKDIYKKLFSPKEQAKGCEPSLKNKIMLSGDYLYTARDINVDDYVELCYYYQAPNPLNPQGEKTLFDGIQILETKTNNVDVPIPFAQAKRIETGFGYGDTPVTKAVHIDRELALFYGQLFEHSEKIASPFLSLPVGSRLDSKKIGTRNVKVIYYNSKFGEPKYSQPTEFPRYFHETISKLEEALGDVTAIHDSSMGKQDPNTRSGLQQAYKIDADDSQHVPDVANFFRMFEVAGNQMLKIMSKKYTEDRYINLFGKDNVKYLKYTGEQLGKNPSVSIEVVAGLPINRMQRQQVLMQLVAAGAIQKNQLLSLLELGELDPVYRRELKDKVRIQMHISDITDKKIDIADLQKEPDKYAGAESNHLVAVKEIVAFCKSSRYTDLSKEVQATLWALCKMHTTRLGMTFREDPIVANYALDLANANEADIQAIMSEVARLTAENQVPVTPVDESSSTPSGEASAPNNVKAVGGSAGPSVEAVAPPKNV